MRALALPIGLLGAVLIVAFSGLSAAQPLPADGPRASRPRKAPPPPADGPRASRARKGSPTTSADIARDHYKTGVRLFDLNKFDDAIVEFEVAYALKEEPAILYNIAQCHRMAGRPAKAVEYYKLFLVRSPHLDEPHRAKVRERIAELSRAQSAPAPGPTAAAKPAAPATVTTVTPVTPPAPAAAKPVAQSTEKPVSAVTETTSPAHAENKDSNRANAIAIAESDRSRGNPTKPPGPARDDIAPGAAPPPRPSLLPGLLVAGGGVLVAGAGLAFGLLARSAADTVESTGAPGAPAPFATVADDEARGQRYTVLSYVAYGIGAAAFLTGGIIALVKWRSGARGPAYNALTPNALTPSRPVAGPLFGVTF